MAELAEVIARFGKPYIEKHRPPARVRGILALIERCRTAALGARMYRCENCGTEVPVYNSCGNRHCPQCLGARRAEWVEQREAELLPLPYFHAVFTLPHELHGLIRETPKAIYKLLFAAAAETLMKFGRDPKHGLEGQLGFLAVLHTWDRTLGFHPHLHILIPGGALCAEPTRFRRVRRPKWLFPPEALSPVFRGIFLERLKTLRRSGELSFSKQASGYADPAAFQRLLDELYATDWVVYAKAPFGGPRQTLRYLARYVHRVAISNQRILEISETTVSFAYRDRRDPSTEQTMTLEGVEFLRRFAQHILPKGFTRIRFYGFWSNSCKSQSLPLIRELLGDHTDAQPAEQNEILNQNYPPEHRCPRCGQAPLLPTLRLLPPTTGPPLAA